jgi:hypothetical protein
MGATCSPALEVSPSRGLEDAAACPHKGPAVAHLLDRGVAATDLGMAATKFIHFGGPLADEKYGGFCCEICVVCG